jgi:hypothetical protein
MGYLHDRLGHLCLSTYPAGLEPAFQAKQVLLLTTRMLFKILQSKLEGQLGHDQGHAS